MYFNFVSLQIDHLFVTNLPEIVVELLMTLHEPATSGASQSTDLCDFSGYGYFKLREFAAISEVPWEVYWLTPSNIYFKYLVFRHVLCF